MRSFLFVSNRKVGSTRLLPEMKIKSRRKLLRVMTMLLLATLKLPLMCFVIVLKGLFMYHCYLIRVVSCCLMLSNFVILFNV